MPNPRTIYRHKAQARKQQELLTAAAAAGLPPPVVAVPNIGAGGKRLFSETVELGFIDLIAQFQAASHPMHVKDVLDMATTVRDIIHPVAPGETRPRVCI